MIGVSQQDPLGGTSPYLWLGGIVGLTGVGLLCTGVFRVVDRWDRAAGARE